MHEEPTCRRAKYWRCSQDFPGARRADAGPWQHGGTGVSGGAEYPTVSLLRPGSYSFFASGGDPGHARALPPFASAANGESLLPSAFRHSLELVICWS
jgi:hypothetical protein